MLARVGSFEFIGDRLHVGEMIPEASTGVVGRRILAHHEDPVAGESEQQGCEELIAAGIATDAGTEQGSHSIGCRSLCGPQIRGLGSGPHAEVLAGAPRSLGGVDASDDVVGVECRRQAARGDAGFGQQS